jgi:hypothetical protein
MPQVGYGIRCYGIIFRCPALFNFAHCPKKPTGRISADCECPKGNGPSWGRDLGGRVLGPSSPGDASVRSPTLNQKNPDYPQPGTEPRRLMFEGISRRAPTPT